MSHRPPRIGSAVSRMGAPLASMCSYRSVRGISPGPFWSKNGCLPNSLACGLLVDSLHHSRWNPRVATWRANWATMALCKQAATTVFSARRNLLVRACPISLFWLDLLLLYRPFRDSWIGHAPVPLSRYFQRSPGHCVDRISAFCRLSRPPAISRFHGLLLPT